MASLRPPRNLEPIDISGQAWNDVLDQLEQQGRVANDAIQQLRRLRMANTPLFAQLYNKRINPPFTIGSATFHTIDYAWIQVERTANGRWVVPDEYLTSFVYGGEPDPNFAGDLAYNRDEWPLLLSPHQGLDLVIYSSPPGVVDPTNPIVELHGHSDRGSQRRYAFSVGAVVPAKQYATISGGSLIAGANYRWTYAASFRVRDPNNVGAWIPDPVNTSSVIAYNRLEIGNTASTVHPGVSLALLPATIRPQPVQTNSPVELIPIGTVGNQVIWEFAQDNPWSTGC